MINTVDLKLYLIGLTAFSGLGLAALNTATAQMGVMTIKANTSEKAAIVCQSYSSAQTVHALFKAGQLGNSPPVNGCWLVDNNSDVVVVDKGDAVSRIRILNKKIGNDAWTLNDWIAAKN